VEKFKYEKVSSAPTSEHSLPSSEREIDWPLVSQEESLFISKNGGRYRGHVEGESGREYKDSSAYRWAYFDPEQRKIVETYLEMEASDGENDALASPREAKGFNEMIVKLDTSGKEITEPYFIDIYPECFSDRKVNFTKLRQIVHEVFEAESRGIGPRCRDIARNTRLARARITYSPRSVI